MRMAFKRQKNMMMPMAMMRRTASSFAAFLFQNLKGERFWVVLAALLTIIQVGSELLLAFPLKLILDKVISHKNPSIPIAEGTLTFLDQFGTSTNLKPGEVHTQLSVILFSVGLLIILSLINSVVTYIQNSIASIVGKNLTARLRKQLFDQLQRLTLDWHNRQKKGDIVQRIIGDVASLERLITDGLIEFVSGILTVVGITVLVVLLSLQFTLLFLVVVPILFVIVYTYLRRISLAVRKAVMAASDVANVATEDVAAITLIKGFAIEDRESMRFTHYVSQVRDDSVSAGELQAQITPIVTFLLSFATAVIIGIGTFVATGNTFTLGFFTIPANAITIGTLTIFLTYLSKLYAPVRSVSRLANLGITAATGAERIQEVFDQMPEVSETTAPYSGPMRLKGEICCQSVVFGYTLDRPVLAGIDLRIPAGRKIGIVGLSGGGKTTLIKLLPRFYEIQQGSITIDGLDHRLYPLTVLRQNISLVLQESILFEGTIRDNIALGRPDATDEEIMDAARKAYIHNTIMTLPDGYNTQVREQGMNFSGGQRQRLAIARAILRDAPILILDEPTASLDVEAEVEVTRALDQLVVGRTVLVVSHRLSTLGNVDEIIVLKDGRITERGTFQELKRLGGLFSGFLAEQNRYNLDREDNVSILRPATMRTNKLSMTMNDEDATIIRRKPTMPTTSVARLFVELDGNVINEYTLNPLKPVVTIGRFEMNDVVVPSRTISRMHARVRRNGAMWLIEDTESLNGLLYRGERIDQTPLIDGDRVLLAPKVAIRYTEV
jgi:ATP-binding cassette subfamily B protein